MSKFEEQDAENTPENVPVPRSGVVYANVKVCIVPVLIQCAVSWLNSDGNCCSGSRVVTEAEGTEEDIVLIMSIDSLFFSDISDGTDE